MADSDAASVGRIFISYRRDDTAYAAGWLFDRLADRFGQHQIFKDVDSIQLGDDFVDVIARAVASCDVLLALIGDQWLTITDEEGRPRLAKPDDFVRIEIETALKRDVRIIPILVEGAPMPSADELPPSLARLARRQALELSPSRFEFDTAVCSMCWMPRLPKRMRSRIRRARHRATGRLRPKAQAVVQSRLGCAVGGRMWRRLPSQSWWALAPPFGGTIRARGTNLD
jgi:TIR domain